MTSQLTMNAVSGSANDVASALSPLAVWQKHCRSAVKRFLRNVVIIDNEPFVDLPAERDDRLPAAHPPQSNDADRIPDALDMLETPVDQGFGSPSADSIMPTTSAALGRETPLANKGDHKIQHESPPAQQTVGQIAPDIHRLDIRRVSDAFSEAGLACAFVLPEYQTSETDKVINRSITAASIADIVVLDWFLNGTSSTLTLSILERIAREDAANNGRLRLICIYTGQPDLDGILTDAIKALANGGIPTSKVQSLPNTAKGNNCLLLVINKGSTPHVELPEKIIEAFTGLSDGLVPSFALASVGAIRNHMHHMLTRFDVGLDSAYVGNRLITDPPEDVAELMRDLLVNECDSALAFDSVAEDFLAPPAILKWLKALDASRPKPAATAVQQSAGADSAPIIELLIKTLGDERASFATKYQTEQSTIADVERRLKDAFKVKEEPQVTKISNLAHVNFQIIEKLLEHGINERGVNLPVGEAPAIEIAEKHRKHISSFLAGSTDLGKVSENKFSRLVGLRREAFATHRSHWKEGVTPALTTGTIVRLSPNETDSQNGKFRYFLCLTPACDMLRLTRERAFTFIEASESSSSHNIVIKNEADEDVFLKFDTKLPEMHTFKFAPHSSKRRVLSTRSTGAGQEVYEFLSTNEIKFTWLGELRYSRVVSEIGKITGTWMRIGVIDSEYLRIMGKS